MMSRVVLLLAVLPGLAVVAVAADEPAPILERLIAGNDGLIARARAAQAEDPGGGFGAREAATRLLVYACGWAAPGSRHHHDAALLAAMELTAGQVAALQRASGLFDSGNLESPPDTAFILEALAKAQMLLERDGGPAAEPLRMQLAGLMARAGPAVAAGGVHTPNHRWGLCAALALTHGLQPDPRYPARIDDWLGEGIDQDADGQYSERSPAYAAKVVNPALLTLAELPGRGGLLAHVRRNLALTWWLTEPDGAVVTLASRRQDQRSGARVSIAEYYLPARWLARKEGDARAAALAAWIERDFTDGLVEGPFDPNWPLAWLLLEPALAGPLPAAGGLPADFAVHLPRSGLARIRRGGASATISGGSDHAAGLGLGSGLATNPTFFTWRRGAAQVALRMTPAFFGTGFFHADGLERTAAGWRLHERREVPYHLPLPAEYRRADGDYALSAEGRFFSKMDFSHRPKHRCTLETEIGFEERDGGWAIDFSVTGQPGVPVTVELALTGEGELAGATPLADLVPARSSSWLRRGGPTGRSAADTAGVFVLREGMGRFRAAGDTIEFGPGSFVQPPGRMEGEDYTWVNGSLRAEGRRVYLTGVTPFQHRLILK